MNSSINSKITVLFVIKMTQMICDIALKMSLSRCTNNVRNSDRLQQFQVSRYCGISQIQTAVNHTVDCLTPTFDLMFSFRSHLECRTKCDSLSNFTTCSFVVIAPCRRVCEDAANERSKHAIPFAKTKCAWHCTNGTKGLTKAG